MDKDNNNFIITKKKLPKKNIFVLFTFGECIATPLLSLENERLCKLIDDNAGSNGDIHGVFGTQLGNLQATI